MAILNRIDIQEQKGIIKTCQDSADVFSKIILKESHGFPEVRVLCDRYENTKLVRILLRLYHISRHGSR